MPLNKKGKKIKKAMVKQYGKKKGESVFYAMENSGKLRKVLKAASGRDAGMGMAGKTGDYGGSKSGNGGRDPSKQYTTKTNLSKKAKDDLAAQRERARARISPSTTATGNVLKGIGVLGFGIPTQITGRIIDRSPMAFGVPKSTRTKKDITPKDRDGGDGSQIIKPVAGPISINKPIIPLAQRRSATVSPTGRFDYTVGLRKGGLLRQGKPKIAKKGWK